jgi:hypothetical protein
MRTRVERKPTRTCIEFSLSINARLVPPAPITQTQGRSEAENFCANRGRNLVGVQ